MEEQKKQESHAIEALKEKEKVIEALRQEISDKGSMIHNADAVIDDIKRQSENLVAELQRKESEELALLQKLDDLQAESGRNQDQVTKRIENLQIEIAQREEQIKAEKLKVVELEELINNDNKLREILLKMKNLEEELELKKDELDVYSLNLEESEFNNGQLEQSIAKLK